MKKFLFIALAAMGFAACENVADDVTPNQSGELEDSYVAISLAADDITRADTDYKEGSEDGKFAEGSDAERKVVSAYIFFFKGNEAFAVSYTDPTTTNTGSCNYLQLALETNPQNPSDMNNVSDIKNAVLVLRNYKGEYPDKMVAVLNWTPAKTSYKFSELKTQIATLGNDTNGYVMSNAVYMDGAGQVVDATPLTIADIYKNEEDALKNPITIQVERIAAKVTFTAKNNGLFPVGKEIDGVPVYAKIQGFELYNDYKESWLIKKIDTAWSDLGFNWNDEAWHRSYWAQSLGKAFENNTFAWNTNAAADDQAVLDGFVYCGENTRKWSEAEDVRTKVIVKAQLVKADGTTPIEVVNWYGKDYVNESDLKIVVANTLANTYFYSENGTSFPSISDADIKCVARSENEENAYEVYFQLSDTGAAKTWYKYENGNYTAIASADVFNGMLANIEPALVYKSGMTYYWTDIKHLGAASKTGEFGVVRNHAYKVNITDIKGYGTPVYEGNIGFIVPDKPEDINTFVAAEIKILSWRLVENDYPLN